MNNVKRAGPLWRAVHRGWVQHILDAVGDNGNVMIDLMDEGMGRMTMQGAEQVIRWALADRPFAPARRPGKLRSGFPDPQGLRDHEGERAPEEEIS